MEDLDRKTPGHKVPITENVLRRTQHGGRYPSLLRLDEESFTGEMRRHEPHGIGPGLVDGGRLWICRDVGQLDPATLHSHLKEEVLLELIGQAELRDPLAYGAEFGGPAWQGGDHRASVGRRHLPRWRLAHGGVPKGLALHRRHGNQPLIGSRLRRDVAGRVHAHIDQLPDALCLLHIARDQGGLDRPQTGGVVPRIRSSTPVPPRPGASGP